MVGVNVDVGAPRDRPPERIVGAEHANVQLTQRVREPCRLLCDAQSRRYDLGS